MLIINEKQDEEIFFSDTCLFFS